MLRGCLFCKIHKQKCPSPRGPGFWAKPAGLTPSPILLHKHPGLQKAQAQHIKPDPAVFNPYPALFVPGKL
jgi:hypothetical protein